MSIPVRVLSSESNITYSCIYNISPTKDRYFFFLIFWTGPGQYFLVPSSNLYIQTSLIFFNIRNNNIIIYNVLIISNLPVQICLHTHAKRTTRNRLSTKQCHYGESHCHENKEHDNRGKTQSPTGYCQIIDSVVLRSVCETKKGEKVLDEEPRKPLTQAREGKKTKEKNKGMKVSHLSQTHNARCQT